MNKKVNKKIGWIFLLVLFFSTGCATSGINKGNFNLYTINAEAAFGKDLTAQVMTELSKEGKDYNDPEVNAYLNKLGQKLVSYAPEVNFQYNFYLVKTPEVNAFALPGGSIFVNTGLIAEADNEAELAGVIAHEIGHVVCRHGTEKLSAMITAGLIADIIVQSMGNERDKLIADLALEIVNMGAFLAYSRANEREADKVGVKILYKAGYNPEAMANFFHKLRKKEGDMSKVEVFFSTHPDPLSREEMVSEIAANFEENPNLILNTPEFEAVKGKIKTIAYPEEKKKKGTAVQGRIRF